MIIINKAAAVDVILSIVGVVVDWFFVKFCFNTVYLAKFEILLLKMI